MIVPMTKYDFVLYRGQKDDFLDRLQELGLVDITTTGWEPDEAERELMLSVERHRTAVVHLRQLASEEGFRAGEPYSDGREAFEKYLEAVSNLDAIEGRIAAARKEVDELAVWGDFDPAQLHQIETTGLKLRYFSAYTKEFEKHLGVWSDQFTVYPVNETGGITYFVVIARDGQEIAIDAQELRPLTESARQKSAQIDELEAGREQWLAVLARCAASLDLIRIDGEQEEARLQLSRVSNTSREEADGTLVILEGWATRETEQKVDKLLEEYPNLFFIKSTPTPDDDTPVLLRNNRFARLFEFIGNFYSLPKYGSMDLTPYFAPFYMIFFGFCLADAGYGLMLLLGGLYLTMKQTGMVKQVGKLTMWCGGATVIFGFLMGSFFGIILPDYEPFASFHDYFLDENKLFPLALGLGIFQILFGMVLKMINYTRQFGFRYALATLGWFIVLVSSLLYLLPEEMGYGPVLGKTAYFILLGVGGFIMLFLNSPGKNPLVNLGAGLWNTYNHLTAILSDVLSYIRLFAIGLSGGILAQVFNALAFGLSPDIPVVRQICILLILLIGHGINLFMSTLSSFVHPMRLTFVEFYGNAGFDPAQRAFTPLRKNIE